MWLGNISVLIFLHLLFQQIVLLGKDVSFGQEVEM